MGTAASARASCSATTSPCRSATGRSIPASARPTGPTSPCYTQKLPNLNGPAAAKTAPAAIAPAGLDAMMLAIRKHIKDFAAIVGLIVIAGARRVGDPLQPAADAARLGAGDRQGLLRDRRRAATAQSVTPGQGQTVNIAGVEVGEIKSVKLVDGRAIIGLKIEPRVRPRLPRRDDPAAAQDRPEGHGRRARRRGRPRPAGCPRAARSRSRQTLRTSTSTRSSPRSTPTRATT